tara:strand:- start:130 stop:675 length:546 start_codon:yes stop_codon:yes gene_type:complete
MKKNDKNLAEDRLVLKIFAYICFIASAIIIYIVIGNDLKLSLLYLALVSAFGGSACLKIAKERNRKNFKTEQDSKQLSSSKIKIKKDRKENFYDDYGYGILMLFIILLSIILVVIISDKLGIPDTPYLCIEGSSNICSIKYLGEFIRVISTPSNLSIILFFPIFYLIFTILMFLGLKPPKE